MNAEHWDAVYTNKAETEVSWYQPETQATAPLVEAAAPDKTAAIIDAGAGDARLLEALAKKGYADLTALDISQAALNRAQARLGPAADKINWICADLRDWRPERQYAVWHDRATFHFLNDETSASAYAELAAEAVRPGGRLIVGGFAEDGPEKCSGLYVRRYGEADLREVFAPAFALEKTERYVHVAPSGGRQHFLVGVFVRAGA